MPSEYVVGRKAKGSDVLVEFANITTLLAGAPMTSSQGYVQWLPSKDDPRVTRILPVQRRGVLTLFARYPKVFERSELVPVD